MASFPGLDDSLGVSSNSAAFVGTWTCTACTYHNQTARTTCEVCEVEAPLPSNYELCHDATGRAYYKNHTDRSTTWERPLPLLTTSSAPAVSTPTAPPVNETGTPPAVAPLVATVEKHCPSCVIAVTTPFCHKCGTPSAMGPVNDFELARRMQQQATLDSEASQLPQDAMMCPACRFVMRIPLGLCEVTCGKCRKIVATPRVFQQCATCQSVAVYPQGATTGKCTCGIVIGLPTPQFSVVPSQNAAPPQQPRTLPPQSSGPIGQLAQRCPWEVSPQDIEKGEFVAKGGFGEVYRGTFHGTDVAIKTLKEGVDGMDGRALEDFRAEIDILSKLRHPRVNLFMGACLTPGSMFIITEFEDMGSLWNLIHDKSIVFDGARQMNIATDTAKGMAYLHKMEILHRDLKSPNLLVNEDWHVKIADFGLSKIGLATATRVGTHNWMAPEVMQSHQYGTPADVYSFGLVLWEVGSRELPFGRARPEDIHSQVLAGVRPPVPPQAPPLLRELMPRCWDAVPQRRPTFASILQHLRTGTPL